MQNVSITKKPGRKPIGECAMTPAQRKARQRRAEKRAQMEAIGQEGNAPMKALLALLAQVEKNETAEHCAKRAWQEIGDRYGWFRDAHE